MPKAKSPAEAAAQLDSIDPDDDNGWYADEAWPGPGGAHQVADSILLDAADPQVADAYRRLVDRCSWWATS